MSEYIFKLPDLGEGTVESEIGEWFIKVGDPIQEEDIVGTVMTDKAAVEVSSPVTGKVVKLAGEPGDVIAVGSMLVVIDTQGTADEGRTTGVAPADPEPAPEPISGSVTDIGVSKVTDPDIEPAPEAVERARVMTSPAIRRRAKEAGIDLALVPGTGPGGRIVRKDFDRFLKARATGATMAAPAVPSTRVKEIKIIGVRRIIAERMQSAKLEIPHFAYV
jgi:2-oxoisovalerate dehydrogenase E2 component (dihydrolipoyl transacylase)